MSKKPEFNPPLDEKISNAVNILYNEGINTFESCQGGEGHAYPEPTIRFHGDRAEGFRALFVALKNNLVITTLSRVYDIIDGEPTGPYWEIILKISQ